MAPFENVEENRLRSMVLSPQQVAQFEREGWLDIGCILSQAEIESHRVAYDSCLAALAEKHAGEDNLPDISRPPRPGLRVHQIRAAHLQHEVFAQLIRRTSITDAVASLVADDLKIILCQGLYKPPRVGGELNWHQVSSLPACSACTICLATARGEGVGYG